MAVPLPIVAYNVALQLLKAELPISEILSGRELKKSPWIGIFVYDFYDDLPTIEVGHIEHAG